jgi:hypothetical protein
VTPEFAEELRAHKTELLAWLSPPPCHGWGVVPPADMPLTTTFPRPTPADAGRVVDYVVRQIRSDIGPGSLCAWCLTKECEYQSRFHWPDAVCCYAAARDAACWQLARTEAGVWIFLHATEAALAVRSDPYRFGEKSA